MSDRGDSRDSGEQGERRADDELEGWTHPAVGDDEREHAGASGERGSEPGERRRPDTTAGEADGEETGGYVPWKTPAAESSRSPREALRDRLGLTDRGWYVVETLLLVAPYPLFVYVYLAYPIDETAFLVVTLLYSLFATYVGLFS